MSIRKPSLTSKIVRGLKHIIWTIDISIDEYHPPKEQEELEAAFDFLRRIVRWYEDKHPPKTTDQPVVACERPRSRHYL